MKQCPKCHRILADSVLTCGDCGYEFPVREKSISLRHARRDHSDKRFRFPKGSWGCVQWSWGCVVVGSQTPERVSP